jgi:NAD(P)-dependent dehydrogenase (short-subunit alcohol dehydrogenase family)
MTERRRGGLVAVITGASRGLGAGIAECWARSGVRLGLCARTTPDAPDGAGRAGVVTASVDVTDAGAVDDFAREVVDHFGRIDLWVNNAGVLAPIGRLADLEPSALHEHLDINVLGVAFGSSTFARHVRSRTGGGVLVNISSGAATTPYEGWGPYCASKAALEMITEVIAREELSHGLRAYALSPGVVDTDMQAMIRSTPAERFPIVGRFRQLHQEGGFNAPAWVASYILDDLVDSSDEVTADGEAGSVRRRVPEQR